MDLRGLLLRGAEGRGGQIGKMGWNWGEKGKGGKGSCGVQKILKIDPGLWDSAMVFFAPCSGSL